MKIHTGLAAAAIAVVGYVKYSRFEDFINKLQLGIEVLSIDNGFANVSIKNLNTRHIPYSFESVNLIIDKTIHAATNREKSTNLSIVPNSQIPINFKMLQNFSKEDLEQSEIVIRFRFFGFGFERLYKPTVVVNEKETKQFCGCGTH